MIRIVDAMIWVIDATIADIMIGIVEATNKLIEVIVLIRE